MALSVADLAYIRSMLPTVATTDATYVTDDQLNYLYSNKADSDLDATIAYGLRQMCIKLSNKVARTHTGTLETMQQQQEREAVCAAAKEWAAITGIPSGDMGLVTSGTINLGIDEEDSEFNIT